MVKFLRLHSLGLTFGGLFLVSLVGQAFAGLAHFNNERIANFLPTIGLGDYVTSSSFAVDVAENWQSEYLQFLLYIVATVWLIQVGSPESKSPSKQGLESDEDQKLGEHVTAESPAWARTGGLRTAFFSWSLALTMGTIFIGSWAAQSVAGWAAFNATRLTRLQDPLSWSGYVTSADFWSRSLQNWQSEFLAIGSMAVLSVYLRQRGSPESKPVGTPHHATGVDG